MTSDPAAEPEDILSDLRKRIDDVDARLLDAVAARARLAQLVGETKRAAAPDSGGAPVHRPGREAQLIRALIARYEGAMSRPAIHAVWRELIGASIALQQAMTIAAASETAEMTARLHFGASQAYLWAASPIASVSAGEADVALFPASDADSWLAAADLIAERDDCALLWRLPFTMPAGGHVAVGRGISADSGVDRTILVIEDGTEVERIAAETLCTLPDGRTVVAIAGSYDAAALPAVLGTGAVQRLGQWPAPLEI